MEGSPIHEYGGRDNGCFVAVENRSLGLIERIDDAILERDGELAGRRFDVSRGDGDDAVRPDDIRVLRDVGILHVAPDFLDGLACGGVGGAFLGLADAALDFGGGHADGDLVFSNEGGDLLPPGVGLADELQRGGRNGFEIARIHPAEDLALLGVAADAIGLRRDGLDLDDLRESQRADVALSREVEVCGRGLEHAELERLVREVGEIDGAGLADDGI